MGKRTLHLIIGIFLIALIHSCSRPANVRQKMTFRLVKDLAYAEMTNDKTSIAFYVALQESPRLKFNTRHEGNLRVVIESDYPSFLKREFNAKASETDLSEFKNRIARLAFFAGGNVKAKFSRMNPEIEDIQTSVPPTMDLESFRIRHEQDNVMIFVFDAMNPLHLGCYGYPKNTSPVLDSLAAEGIIWEKAFAPAPYTLASTGSLLVGLYPAIHGVLAEGDKLPEQFKTMAEFFRDSGYETGMFIGTPNATKIFGYAQGFKHVWSPARVIDADEIRAHVQTWLKKVQNRPFFSYVHIREPHLPFKPPPEFLRRFRDEPNFLVPQFEFSIPPSDEDKSKIRDVYDANIAFGDSELGNIFASLRALGLDQKTIIIVLSDHGEAFWEHQVQGHNLTLYDEMLRIPLIIRFPQEPKLTKISKTNLVANFDIFPTLVDLFPFSRKGIFLSGKSLLPYLLSETKHPDRILHSQRYGNHHFALRSSTMKYIRDYERGREEFYDLSTDPSETKNLIRSYPILSRYYRAQLEKTRDKQRRARDSLRIQQPKAVIDDQTREHLKALGYAN